MLQSSSTFLRKGLKRLQHQDFIEALETKKRDISSSSSDEEDLDEDIEFLAALSKSFKNQKLKESPSNKTKKLFKGRDDYDFKLEGIQPSSSQCSTKIVSKNNSLINRINTKEEQEDISIENQMMKYTIDSNSDENQEDDDDSFTELVKISLACKGEQEILKLVNEEECLGIEIHEVYKNDTMSDYCWKLIKQMGSEDPFFEKKNIKQQYSVIYLKCGFKQLPFSLIEKLKGIEVGLVLIGSILTDIEYQSGDSGNFIGKFKINKTQQGKLLFTSLLHHQQVASHETPLEDFFSHNNVLILEPEYILYPTLIAQSTSCYRTPLIKMKFSMTETTNWNMLKGSIVHDIFEELMDLHSRSSDYLKEGEDLTSRGFFRQVIENLYAKYSEDLFLLDKDIEQFESEIKPLTKNMLNFVTNYLVKGTIYYTSTTQRKIRIIKLIENEMTIINEMIGLKGQIDCLFLCEVEEGITGETYKCVLPFELKTGGKKKSCYDDQSLFYSILLNEKRKTKRNLEGFLYYLSFNEIISLSPSKQKMHSLIARRNKLAKMIKSMETKGELPPINPKRPDICKYCYEKEACFSSQIASDLDQIKDIEDLPNNYALGKDFEDFHSLFDGMTEGSKLYLQHWLKLIQLEQEYDRNQKKEKQEQMQADLNDEAYFAIINFKEFFEYKMSNYGMGLSLSQHSQEKALFQNKASQEISSQEDKNYIFMMKVFPDNDKLMIASEHYREGESFVLSQIDIKSKLKAILEEKIIQEEDFTLILKLKPISEQISFEEKKTKKLIEIGIGQYLKWNAEHYSKDQYPDQRQNILNLILNRVANQKEFKSNLNSSYNLKQKNNGLISSIIDNSKPTFNNKEFKIDQILQQYPALSKNRDQAYSIQKVLTSDSLTCVVGMPGTGKTFLIAYLIKILASEGRTVMVTSFTNSALDNIIIKVLELFPELKDVCLRRGSNKNIIHPVAQEIHYNSSDFKSQEDFSNYFAIKKIFFCTIIGSNNKLFHSDKLDFDFCIIDEASQCVEPLCLGPILQCRKSILIGDHNQLQPLVKCGEAGKKGLSISLFERMCTKYPCCVAELRSQFRMNEEIMELSNIMVYNGKLKAFDESIGKRRLVYTNPRIREDVKSMKIALDPQNPVVFLDTSEIIFFNKSEQEQILRNQVNVQVSLIVALAARLRVRGILPKDIGVITPYNAYRMFIVKRMQQVELSSNEFELFTIDKSQGIDKQVVIFHCPDKLGEQHLLSNWRRMNVALTRAKAKLVIIGSKTQMSKHPVLCDLLGLLVARNYVQSVTSEEEASINQMNN